MNNDQLTSVKQAHLVYLSGFTKPKLSLSRGAVISAEGTLIAE
jgi:hypothetical protein